MRATEPLRDEHRTMHAAIERLREVGDLVGVAPPCVVRAGVDEVRTFLTNHLIPHAKAEDGVLYPAVESAMGAPGATRTMSREHVEIERLTERLVELAVEMRDGELGERRAPVLSHLLYGLHTLLRLHVAKEESIYLPVLDEKLTVDEAAQLFERMHRAALDARCSADAFEHDAVA